MERLAGPVRFRGIPGKRPRGSQSVLIVHLETGANDPVCPLLVREVLHGFQPQITADVVIGKGKFLPADQPDGADEQELQTFNSPIPFLVFSLSE